jgi:hypothetical protein
MKTIFDKTTRDEIIARINSLNDNNKPQWGKMNVYQMIKHANLADEMLLGKKAYKRVFLGRILGKMVLKKMLKDDSPMDKNAPTGHGFIITELSGDIAVEKAKWISSVSEYAGFDNNDFEHWFFGKMTREQVGQFAYKHNDHHLRQFGV